MSVQTGALWRKVSKYIRPNIDVTLSRRRLPQGPHAHDRAGTIVIKMTMPQAQVTVAGGRHRSHPVAG